MLVPPPQQMPSPELTPYLEERDEERGFVLPIVAGLGLIMILVGITMITRSHQNRIIASTQKSIVASLAAAETGITKYQALLNTNRMYATYCSHPTSDPACRSAITWQNLCEAEKPVSRLAERINNVARTDWHHTNRDPWQNLPGNTNAGEYRLVNYIYTAADINNPNSLPGKGTLIVEGRLRTSMARLSVEFPVSRGSSQPPALWVQEDPVAVPPDVVIQTSQCSTKANAFKQTPGLLPALPDEGNHPPGYWGIGFQSIAQINHNITLQSSPVTTKVDSLDTQQASDDDDDDDQDDQTGGNRLIHNPVSDENLDEESDELIEEAAEETSIQVPPNGGTASPSKVMTYQIGDDSGGGSGDLSNVSDGPLIQLSGGNNLTVGTGNETVVIYAYGDINVSEGSAIILTPGSKLIMYVHGDITLAGNAIQNSGTPDQVEVYVYGGRTVSITGATSNPVTGTASDPNTGEFSNPIKLSLFAPASVVRMNDVNVEGIIWAQEWQQTGRVTLKPDRTNMANTKASPPQIQPITRWQRLPLPLPNEVKKR